MLVLFSFEVSERGRHGERERERARLTHTHTNSSSQHIDTIDPHICVAPSGLPAFRQPPSDFSRLTDSEGAVNLKPSF